MNLRMPRMFILTVGDGVPGQQKRPFWTLKECVRELHWSVFYNSKRVCSRIHNEYVLEQRRPKGHNKSCKALSVKRSCCELCQVDSLHTVGIGGPASYLEQVSRVPPQEQARQQEKNRALWFSRWAKHQSTEEKDTKTRYRVSRHHSGSSASVLHSKQSVFSLGQGCTTLVMEDWSVCWFLFQPMSFSSLTAL